MLNRIVSIILLCGVAHQVSADPMWLSISDGSWKCVDSIDKNKQATVVVATDENQQSESININGVLYAAKFQYPVDFGNLRWSFSLTDKIAYDHTFLINGIRSAIYYAHVINDNSIILYLHYTSML